MNAGGFRSSAEKGEPAHPSKRGVYFLANDRVIDLVVAFLNSFRLHNPSLSLCLIPYDGETAKISALASVYNFTCFAPEELLRFCDQLSSQYHSRVAGQYRKLVAWAGPFDEFIYIDVDTVVLQSVDWIFPFLQEFEVVTSHSDLPSIRQFVWKDSVFQAGGLAAQEIAFAANTGFIASRSGVLSLEKIRRPLAEALRLRAHMELLCYEQPLLNYLIVKCARQYSSLSTLKKTRGLNLMQEHWGGSPFGLSFRGRFWVPGKPTVLLVHWAGAWQLQKRDEIIFSLLRRVWKTTPRPAVRYFLYHALLWRYYRRYQPLPAWRNQPVNLTEVRQANQGDVLPQSLAV